MAGIKLPIQSVLTKLKEIQDFKTVRIWNNHVKYEHAGQSYDFPKPALFLEVVNSPVYEQLGRYFQDADLGWKVHIVHEHYDAQDGNFEQDLEVFDLRDSVVGSLSGFMPIACGPLTKKGEGQDYEHDNIYHYTIDFVSNFIDSSGSPDRPGSGAYIQKDPPIDLEVDPQIITREELLTPGLYPENLTTATQSYKQFQIPK